MEAWIMGRQSMTWQHPTCFVQGLSFEVIALYLSPVGIRSNLRSNVQSLVRSKVEKQGGRGKCKVSLERFATGETKVACRSHTATIYLKLAPAADALADALALVPDFDPSGVAGFAELSTSTQNSVIRALGSQRVNAAPSKKRSAEPKTKSTTEVPHACSSDLMTDAYKDGFRGAESSRRRVSSPSRKARWRGSSAGRHASAGCCQTRRLPRTATRGHTRATPRPSPRAVGTGGCCEPRGWQMVMWVLTQVC